MTGSDPVIEIGVLTRGKPTLGMTLVSLLLQDWTAIRIHIVDTGEAPAVRRDDVVFAQRLAIDRGIRCTYEYLRERERAFSLGRLRLLEELRGPHLCFMDDDIVVPSAALRQIVAQPEFQTGYGFIAPVCRNSPLVAGPWPSRVRYTPGAVFYQDALLRDLLLAYYRTTTDVLDAQRTPEKVWEIAALSTLFELLGRPCIVQTHNTIYHLDYHERPDWHLVDERLIARSAASARALWERFRSRWQRAPDALSAG